MIVTGVGARDTGPATLEFMYSLGARFATRGWTLRSGAAEGADSAFEKGCDSVSGKKEIYLPWAKFNGRLTSVDTFKKDGYVLGASGAAFQMVERVLGPAHWGRLSDGGRKLHARNAHQLLGKELTIPSDILVCWTQNGEVKGGTATAIKLAAQWNIPTYNLFNEEDRLGVLALLKAEQLDLNV